VSNSLGETLASDNAIGTHAKNNHPRKLPGVALRKQNRAVREFVDAAAIP
jgi:hypothetical protein